MEAEFSLIDVFSDRPFGGNQLAVFPRAECLSDEVMQQRAREFNFAESTFVLPLSDPACTHRVRIFTPRPELPFAGHPTVGTAAVTADVGEDPVFEQPDPQPGHVVEPSLPPVAAPRERPM